MEIDNNAPVITRDEIKIAAPIETVWKLHTAINGWTDWNKDIESAKLDAPLAVGSTFYWETAGMKIISTIGELSPPEKIAWSGEVQGIMGVHVWRFAAVEGGTLVQTEESWSSEPVTKKIAATQKALDQSLRSWLESLKRKAETREITK